MVWQTSHLLTLGVAFIRIFSAWFPVAQLWIGKLIIDQLVHPSRATLLGIPQIWAYVACEVVVIIIGDLTARAGALLDSLLGDRFTNHISTKLMEHAAALDLKFFEDPIFYDKLERANRQATSRLALVTALTGLVQQFLTLLSLSTAVAVYSPWLLLLMFVTLLPSFFRETRFAPF